MIEVERKFNVSRKDINRLTKNAHFLGEKEMIDSYYDDQNYSLTSKDWWLRNRQGRFELKIPLHAEKDGVRLADQYRELETESEIYESLGIQRQQDLQNDLVMHGYKPFCTLTTTRKKYQKNEFIIDLDSVSSDNFEYMIGEIELMVGNQLQVEHAIQRIMDFANRHKLTIAPVRGKVIEYLRLIKPEHYRVLVKHGVVSGFQT